MGKSESPPTPDYAKSAEQTAASNLAASRSATTANRPNQITPYGSSTWTNGKTFDQSGYDAAMAKFQQGQTGGTYDDGENGTGYYRPGTSSGTAPNKDDYYSGQDDWTQTTSLDPRIQQTLDKQIALSDRYADLAGTGLDKAYDTLSDPTLDVSQLPQRAINPGQTAQDAIMARLRPQNTADEEALRTRLANQGIGIGSEAADNEFRGFNNKLNDQQMQAGLYGLDLDTKNRASALQEQAYLKDRPLNLVNALRTGAQVQNPTFGSFSNQATTSGTDYSGATSSAYKADVASQNVENKNSEQNMQGIAAIAAMMF